SLTNQSFTLKRPPLTYVSAPTPSGSASTLQVEINGLEWQEAPTLYGLTATDNNYIVRLADDGTPTITFGDPAARLKTGQQNVTATYRTGIGLAGNVSAGSLSMLQSRPPGLRGVTNPLAASGGADPQVQADARTSAPLAVLTLDRIGSLDDSQRFTQAFAGVGKAQAVQVWGGHKQVVHITVADAGGNTINSTSPLYQVLVQGINRAHDPVQDFLVAGYQSLVFNLTATILVDEPTYQFDVVEAQVIAAIAPAFSFANRAFGQSVTAAELITLIQSVAGVIATDLTQLYFTSDSTGPSQSEPPPFLIAQSARWQGNTILPAQLLLVNPLGISLGGMTS
ncbi:MAG TPA: baseplate J/gp47 family protein, partial [Acidisoma sp.]|nr:baseplate J/gp47 family protein [Acidisoma sp.]